MVGAPVVMADEEITADQHRALEALRSEFADVDPAALTPMVCVDIHTATVSLPIN